MLLAAGYHENSHILHVVFRTRKTYRYQKVPSFEYDGLMSAESKGRYMHDHIIDRYDFEQI